jgi:hypothetical protein
MVTAGSLIVDGGRVVAIDPRPRVDPAGATLVDIDTREDLAGS